MPKTDGILRFIDNEGWVVEIDGSVILGPSWMLSSIAFDASTLDITLHQAPPEIEA